MAIDKNDPRPADTDNKLLQKILERLKSGIGLTNSAIDIGKVDQGIPGVSPWPISGTVVVSNLPATLGQKTMANSESVAIASDQSSLPVTIGNFPATQPVSVANGVDITQGGLADATASAATLDVTPTTAASSIAIQKAILNVLYRSSVDTTPLNVVIAAGLKQVNTSFNRPANTTAYAANQVVSNNTIAGSSSNLTFTAVVASNTGAAYISKARLVLNSSVTTNGQFRLFLFTVNPTPLGDAAQNTLLYAARAQRIGWIDFAVSTSGTGSDCAESEVVSINLPFVAVDSNLYGVLVATAAYVPTSAEPIFVELTIDPN